MAFYPSAQFFLLRDFANTVTIKSHNAGYFTTAKYKYDAAQQGGLKNQYLCRSRCRAAARGRDAVRNLHGIGPMFFLVNFSAVYLLGICPIASVSYPKKNWSDAPHSGVSYLAQLRYHYMY